MASDLGVTEGMQPGGYSDLYLRRHHELAARIHP